MNRERDAERDADNNSICETRWNDSGAGVCWRICRYLIFEYIFFARVISSIWFRSIVMTNGTCDALVFAVRHYFSHRIFVIRRYADLCHLCSYHIQYGKSHKFTQFFLCSPFFFSNFSCFSAFPRPLSSRDAPRHCETEKESWFVGCRSPHNSLEFPNPTKEFKSHHQCA